MGATFDSVTFHCSESELKNKFSEHQQREIASRGSHSYAGHIGIVSGLDIDASIFDSESEAEDYLVDYAVKHGPAIAVKVREDSGIFPKTQIEKKDLEKFKEIQVKTYGYPSELVKRAKEAKSAFKGCKHCGSNIATEYIKSKHCPVCSYPDFLTTETDKKVLARLRERLEEYETRIKTHKKKYMYGKTYWYVGAWCAS